MRSAFDLRLSTGAPYRALAAEVAGKVVELAGGGAVEARGFGADLAAVVEELAAEAPMVACRFVTEEGHVEVVVDGAGRSRTVRLTLRGPKD